MCSIMCPLCAQTKFESVDALRVSLIKAANDPICCPICHMTFLGLDKLTIHLFSHTTAMQTNAINISANEETSQAACTKYDQIEQLQPQILPLENSCNKNTTDPSSVGNEVDMRTVMPTLQFPCDFCEHTFHSENIRDMHVRLVHQESTLNISKEDESNAHGIHKCHLCTKSFKMKGSLRVHLKVVHATSAATQESIEQQQHQTDHPPHSNILPMGACASDYIVGISVNDADLTPRTNRFLGSLDQANMIDEMHGRSDGKIMPDNPKIWECDVCSKSFTTKYFLKKHKRLHTGEMPYTCHLCGRTFTFQQSYHKHLLYHSDEKPHICSTCNRSFKELSTLHNHERIHSGEKPFNCEVCGKCFRQRVSFLVHTRIHTGVMPYKCETCGKSFRYKVSQRTHKCVPLIADSTHVEPIFGEILHSDSDICSSSNMQKLADCNIISNHTLDEELLTKTIDDFVVETCNKLGINNVSHETTLSSTCLTNTICEQNNNSHSPITPSENFENMHLYSPGSSGQKDTDNNFPTFLLDDKLHSSM